MVKVKMSVEEIYNLLDLLESYDCLTDWEVETVQHLQRKFKSAMRYSIGNYNKISLMRIAINQKQLEKIDQELQKLDRRFEKCQRKDIL